MTVDNVMVVKKTDGVEKREKKEKGTRQEIYAKVLLRN